MNNSKKRLLSPIIVAFIIGVVSLSIWAAETSPLVMGIVVVFLSWLGFSWLFYEAWKNK